MLESRAASFSRLSAYPLCSNWSVVQAHGHWKRKETGASCENYFLSKVLPGLTVIQKSKWRIPTALLQYYYGEQLTLHE